MKKKKGHKVDNYDDDDNRIADHTLRAGCYRGFS